MPLENEQDIYYLLEKIKNGDNKQENLSRIKKLMSRHFGYDQELLEYLSQPFNIFEFYQFLESNEKKRPITIRVNSLRIKKV